MLVEGLGLGKGISVRLYVKEALGERATISLSKEHSHYLFGVMRRGLGDQVLLFNGIDGEWRAEVTKASKAGELICASQERPQTKERDLQLLFAPVKKARTDFIVEKATELGVSRISPVFTDFTNSERVRPDRFEKIAIEAAEQSRRLSVPAIDAPVKLSNLLSAWDGSRALVFLNETEGDQSTKDLRQLNGPCSMLVGPEGGFSDGEIKMIKSAKGTRSISLGPLILRADTAVVAGLTLIQSRSGDWG